METINSLTKKISACITKRKYSVNSVLSKFAQHTAILNYRITELLFKRLSGDINDTEAASQIEHFYDDNDDLNGYAKTLRSDTLKKCFNRYVSCENRVPVEAPNAIIDVYGLEVNVDPTSPQPYANIFHLLRYLLFSSTVFPLLDQTSLCLYFTETRLCL